MLRFRLLLVSSLALAACSDVTGIDRLEITVAVSPDSIVQGETAMITVRITNPTATPIEIPYRCVSTFEVANAQGELVFGDESVVCVFHVHPGLVLAPFESIERVAPWDGKRFIGGPTWAFEPVPAGLYRVYGKVEGRRSRPDTIVVEAP